MNIVLVSMGSFIYPLVILVVAEGIFVFVGRRHAVVRAVIALLTEPRHREGGVDPAVGILRLGKI